MSINTLSNQKRYTAFAKSTTKTFIRLSDQLVEKLGTSRMSEVISKIIELSKRTNFVENPSFEINISNWRVVSGTLVRKTSDNKFGIACGSFTPSGTGVWAGWQNNNLPMNTQFCWSTYVKGTLNETFDFNIYDGNIDNMITITFTGAWQRVSQIIPTFNGVYVNPPEMQIRCDNGNTINEILFDGVLVEQTGILDTYFDGSMQNSSWTGIAHASSSNYYPKKGQPREKIINDYCNSL